MTGRSSEDKAAILELMIELADAAQATIAETLREFGAPASSGTVVRILATSDRPVTPRELARRLGRDPSTATLTADKLERAHLVVREPHPDDGRKRALVLTERGHELWETLRSRLHASALLEGLSVPERRQLLGLLTAMQASSQDAGPGQRVGTVSSVD